jgi:DNA (cytosine-5)-methyltransferase 1
MKEPRVLELFAGAGGAAFGLHRSGWKHAACVEFDRAAAATLAAADFPVLCADVRTADWTPWMGQIELLWASPPCQPGSTAGRRKGSQDSRDGWPSTWQAVDAIRPTWFIAENVLGWTYHSASCSKRSPAPDCVGCSWEQQVTGALAKRFAHAGVWLLNAADFGTPQHRRRVFLWGGPAPLQAPTQTHADPAALGTRKPWISVGEAIGTTLLAPKACTQRACYPCDGAFGRACTEPWRRDRPAPTVTTTEVKGTRAHAPAWSFNGGPDRASDMAFLVAGVRRITVEEGLALQGMPAAWPLQGSIEEQYRQVGNLVPPQLSRAIGTAVLQAHLHPAHLGSQGPSSPEVTSHNRGPSM